MTCASRKVKCEIIASSNPRMCKYCIFQSQRSVLCRWVLSVPTCRSLQRVDIVQQNRTSKKTIRKLTRKSTRKSATKPNALEVPSVSYRFFRSLLLRAFGSLTSLKSLQINSTGLLHCVEASAETLAVSLMLLPLPKHHSRQDLNRSRSRDSCYHQIFQSRLSTRLLRVVRRLGECPRVTLRSVSSRYCLRRGLQAVSATFFLAGVTDPRDAETAANCAMLPLDKIMAHSWMLHLHILAMYPVYPSFMSLMRSNHPPRQHKVPHASLSITLI
ncbi:hypothetical protein KCU71_g93, partial [Aureobasidium melanogenum]